MKNPFDDVKVLMRECSFAKKNFFYQFLKFLIIFCWEPGD